MRISKFKDIMYVHLVKHSTSPTLCEDPQAIYQSILHLTILLSVCIGKLAIQLIRITFGYNYKLKSFSNRLYMSVLQHSAYHLIRNYSTNSTFDIDSHIMAMHYSRCIFGGSLQITVYVLRLIPHATS